MELQLEVGKKYKTRKGGFVRIARYQPDVDGGYCYIGNNFSYLPNGRYFNDGNISDIDLVEEVTK